MLPFRKIVPKPYEMGSRRYLCNLPTFAPLRIAQFSEKGNIVTFQSFQLLASPTNVTLCNIALHYTKTHYLLKHTTSKSHKIVLDIT